VTAATAAPSVPQCLPIPRSLSCLYPRKLFCTYVCSFTSKSQILTKFHTVSYLDLPDLASLSLLSPFLARLASDPALHKNRIRITAPSRVKHSLFGLSPKGLALRPTVADLVHRGIMRGLGIERRWRMGIYFYSHHVRHLIRHVASQLTPIPCSLLYNMNRVSCCSVDTPGAFSLPTSVAARCPLLHYSSPCISPTSFQTSSRPRSLSPVPSFP